MEQVAKDLNLDGVDGIDINNTETIFRKRKPVAAVVFHHSNVFKLFIIFTRIPPSITITQLIIYLGCDQATGKTILFTSFSS